MLPITLFREETERVIAGLSKKHVNNPAEKVADILRADDARRHAQQLADELKSQSKKLSEEIGPLMKAGKKEEAEPLKAKVTSLKTELEEAEKTQIATEKLLDELIVSLPNVPHISVPVGKTPEENEVVLQITIAHG
jgi:seryl-tRNA synthetase